MNTLATQAWQWLQRELDCWQKANLKASFWWRDDDATEPGDQLDRLLTLSQLHQVPLALAVIPAKIKPGLAGLLNELELITVLQHGFAHENHAAGGQRKLELGGDRKPKDIVTDLAQGYRVMQQQFGERFVAVLVPPWNRINSKVLVDLPKIGFGGISTMKVRRDAYPIPQLLQVNAHLDPVNWRHHGGFIGIYPAIAILIQHLQAKRKGYRDAAEPTGLLTHHLAQNDAVWCFGEELLGFLCAHPAAEWCDAKSIWCHD